MNHTIEILRATSAHIDALVPLFDAYRQFYGQSPDESGSRPFLAQRMQRHQSAIFLALQDSRGCGFTQLYPAFSSVAMRPIWILNDLFVAEDARRQGVAKQLMQTAVEFARSNGAKRLVLATGLSNHAAQALYEAIGWTRDDAFVHYQLEM
ncbi:MAG: N-acetyltransferase family protein [Planctomycetaceae bacterium]